MIAARLVSPLLSVALLSAALLIQTAPAPAQTATEPVTPPPAVVPEAPAAPQMTAPQPAAPVAPAPAATGGEPPAAPAGEVAPAAPGLPGTGLPGTATGTAPAAGPRAPDGAAAAPGAGGPALAAGETPALPPAEAPQFESIMPHDLSPIGMYQAADVVVKAVMIGLVVASLITWTVALVKVIELFFANRAAGRALSAITSAHSLTDALGVAEGRRDPASYMLRAAHGEFHRSAPALDRGGEDGVKERVGSLLSRLELQAVRRLNRGTGLLATIGSTAPFIGLFGTVWGIMNSFIGIAESGTTNLAIVAPGIAEALLATAIGLVAAIPAVIIYNLFARSIAGYRARLGDASAGILRLVSRDLDFRGLHAARAAAE